ncbi:MAG TPA: FAD-dependent oxidoreductase [Desulfoprunum sp.]|nr:FAD-dependent oxidoreductase [Desulfoprunum sp.]
MGKRIVIIGGVAAGPKAASRIKRVLPEADVTLIDQDNLISYGGCGIPYYVSGDVSDEQELRSTSFHMVRDAYFFAQAKGVRTMTSTRALAIDRREKTVAVEDLATGARSVIPYDNLMLATGSEPFVLPIPGVDADGVFTISDLHKAIEIKKRIAQGMVGKAVVIGGGAIGVEMAEALTDLWGIETAIVEFMDQLLPKIVDWPLAAALANHLRQHNVEVYLGEAATEIVVEDGKAVGVRTGKRTIDADMVIMAVGVRPRSQLAREAGLNVAANGGIVVNDRMQTSDPAIYAAGDCVEIRHLVSGRGLYAPLGSLANKEGRVAADNMAGIPAVFKGGIGSFVMKAFDMAIGATGLSLEMARAQGFQADSSLTASADRAHFFPGSEIICLELVFDRRTRKVLGFQGIGPMNDALSVRIDAAAVAITAGATIDDFANIEMAYAPPFSTAIDAINSAAYAAENLCDGRMRQIDIQSFLAWLANPSTRPDWVALDVRHPKQAQPNVEKFGAALWLSLPYDKVRSGYQDLPSDKIMIIVCNAGSRSYESQIALDAAGLRNTLVLPGGYNLIKRIDADILL